eukprot:9240566-Karenia_brevis.AAC.1
MAICESQLLEYSRSLTKRNKFYIGKQDQNFDDPQLGMMEIKEGHSPLREQRRLQVGALPPR